MNPRFVVEMAEGGRVDGVYVVKSREMRVARSGESFLALELADKTGTIGAVFFRPSHAAIGIPSGVAAHVVGRVTSYRGRRRVTVDSLAAADAWQLEDLVSSALRPKDEMEQEFNSLARSVGNPSLRKVLRSVFGDKNFFAEFCLCPASEHHHATVSGLLEHTVAVASMCSGIAERYQQADSDLLLAAALLHDIGRVDELTHAPSILRTDEGRLLGHTVCGLMRVRQAAIACKLESSLRMRLEHAILSHHDDHTQGQTEPCTIEGLLLRQVNDLDATVTSAASVIGGATRLGESWTDASNPFARALHAPSCAA